MGRLSTDVQTKSQKIISNFSISLMFFFLTDLILSDQAVKIWKHREFEGLLDNFFSTIFKPRAKKNYFRFYDMYLHFFFNRLNIIRSSRQKYGCIGNFKAIQKWAYFQPISKPRTEKNYFQFFDIFFFFFKRLNIIRSS